MKFETKLERLGIDENEVKSIIMNCECGEINGAYFIDLTKEKKEFIMEVVGNYLDDDSEEFEGWTDIKRIATFCKTFDISEDEIPNYYRLGFNEGGCDIAYNLESNKDVILVLTDDERYHNSFIQYSPSQQSEEETEEEIRFVAKYNGGDTYILDTKEQADLEMENACDLINYTLNEKRFVCKTLSNGIVLLKDNNVRRLLNVFETADFLNSLDCIYYDDDSEEKWVSFKIVSKNDDRIYLTGQFDVNSYDEDTDLGDWEYEQNDGTMASHLPRYWKVNGENLSFDYEQFIDSIDWDLLQQYLFDFAEENKSMDFGKYVLHINEGACVEMEIRKYSDFEDTYWATVMFRYNRDFIEFDENIIKDLAESISFDGEYRITSASSIDLELPKQFSNYAEENYEGEIEEIISEMIETVREHFARQLSRDAGVFTDYGENIEQLVEEDIASDMEQMFLFNSAVSRNCVKDWLVENAYLEE